MIETCLSELYSVLPDAELRRIQKTLKIIVSRGLDRERLRRVVREGYSRLGQPFEVLERQGIGETFLKLLDRFGVLSTDQMSDAEKADLLKNPYTIWPDERHCVLSGEALELLAQESIFRKRNYLYGELTRLSVKERRAWYRWLGLECSVRSEKDRCHQIYLHLAGERRRSDAPPAPREQEFPEFLDQIFPNDPLKSPVAWFYRDILPLYQALADAEKQLKALQPGTRGYRDRKLKLDVIDAFKRGALIARAEPPVFGEATRYRLMWTREAIPATSASRKAAGRESAPEELPPILAARRQGEARPGSFVLGTKLARSIASASAQTETVATGLQRRQIVRQPEARIAANAFLFKPAGPDRQRVLKRLLRWKGLRTPLADRRIAGTALVSVGLFFLQPSAVRSKRPHFEQAAVRAEIGDVQSEENVARIKRPPILVRKYEQHSAGIAQSRTIFQSPFAVFRSARGFHVQRVPVHGDANHLARTTVGRTRQRRQKEERNRESGECAAPRCAVQTTAA